MRILRKIRTVFLDILGKAHSLIFFSLLHFPEYWFPKDRKLIFWTVFLFKLLFIPQKHFLVYTLFNIHLIIQSFQVQPQFWRPIHSTEEFQDECLCSRPYLWLPAVTLFSLFHVAIAALLASIKHLDFWHVVQTHAHTFLQTGSKVLLTACTEDCWEWIPTTKMEEQGWLKWRNELYKKNSTNLPETPKKNPASCVLLLLRNQNDLEKSGLNHSSEPEHRQSFHRNLCSVCPFRCFYTNLMADWHCMSSSSIDFQSYSIHKRTMSRETFSLAATSRSISWLDQENLSNWLEERVSGGVCWMWMTCVCEHMCARETLIK